MAVTPKKTSNAERSVKTSNQMECYVSQVISSELKMPNDNDFHFVTPLISLSVFSTPFE